MYFYLTGASRKEKILTPSKEAQIAKEPLGNHNYF